MKITSVHIHNFRSIEDATIQLGDYALLVGENNAGKSNVIDALRVFYEKGLKYSDLQDAPKFKTKDTEAWMEIEFELTKAEGDNLKDDYRLPDCRLRVRKYLRASNGRKPGIYGYKADGSLEEGFFYGAKNIQQGKLGDIIYIEDVTKLSDETKMSGPSALRDLIQEVVKKLVGSSASFQDLKAQFDRFSGVFKTEKTPDGTSLQGLERDINEEIAEWDVGFELQIDTPTEDQIVKNLVSHQIQDRCLEQPVAPERCGQGFQRCLIYALIRLVAKYQPLPRPKDKKEFSPQLTLLLFEEPEAFLHPMQQKSMCGSLRTIGAREGNQVLASTHSPCFVSRSIDDIPSIVRLWREEGRSRFGQIDAKTLAGITSDNQQIFDAVKGTKFEGGEDDIKDEMEAIKYFIWLDSERAGAFFARRVLLVEGQTEKVLVNALLDTGKLQMPKGGVFVLDCMGKFNIHRFMNLFGPLGISHGVLYDSDGNVDWHAKIGELIERSRNGCTGKIHPLPGDIESFLNVEKVKEPNRKPQHMMIRFQEGRILEERVAEFVKLAEELIA